MIPRYNFGDPSTCCYGTFITRQQLIIYYYYPIKPIKQYNHQTSPKKPEFKPRFC
jgi:hypothetical protein